MLYQFGNSGLFMNVCLRSQPSCHASLKLAGYSNLLNEDILKMSNLKLSQPGVYIFFLKISFCQIFSNKKLKSDPTPCNLL